jgi:hypothetical protein
MHDPTSRQEQAAAKAKKHSEAETLKEGLSNIAEECGMLPPGMQALSGFQTIAVFHRRFGQSGSLRMDAHLLPLAIVGAGDRARHGAGRLSPRRPSGPRVASPDRAFLPQHWQRAADAGLRAALSHAPVLAAPSP